MRKPGRRPASGQRRGAAGGNGTPARLVPSSEWGACDDAPDADEAKTPVIAPPATPGGDQKIVPKEQHLKQQFRWNWNIDAGERFDWGGFRSPKEKSHGSAVKNKKHLKIPDFHLRRLAAVPDFLRRLHLSLRDLRLCPRPYGAPCRGRQSAAAAASNRRHAIGASAPRAGTLTRSRGFDGQAGDRDETSP